MIINALVVITITRLLDRIRFFGSKRKPRDITVIFWCAFVVSANCPCLEGGEEEEEGQSTPNLLVSVYKFTRPLITRRRGRSKQRHDLHFRWRREQVRFSVRVDFFLFQESDQDCTRQSVQVDQSGITLFQIAYPHIPYMIADDWAASYSPLKDSCKQSQTWGTALPISENHWQNPSIVNSLKNPPSPKGKWVFTLPFIIKMMMMV